MWLLILSLLTYYFEVSTSVEAFCAPPRKAWEAAGGSLGWEAWGLPLGQALVVGVRLCL